MDAAILQAIASAGTVALGVATLVVARLDKSKEPKMVKESIDAILDLERVIDSWCRDAARTNELFKAHLAGSIGWDAVQDAIETQAFNFFGERIPDLEISDDAALWEHYRLSNRKRRERLHQFLRIYAPEFADQFNSAADERFGLLHSLVFGPHPTAADESAALEKSSTELNLALQKLREYIRDNIKPTAS